MKRLASDHRGKITADTFLMNSHLGFVISQWFVPLCVYCTNICA